MLADRVHARLKDLSNRLGNPRGPLSTPEENSGNIRELPEAGAQIRMLRRTMSGRWQYSTPRMVPLRTPHIVGSLTEFETPAGLNEAKIRAFELYRHHIGSPEILTFDELLNRARFIVDQPRAD